MSFAQPSLFGDDQADLFGSTQPKPAAYKVNPQHVINRFIEFDAKLKDADTWPWDDFWIETYRTRTWPYLFNKLIEIGHAEDAAKWKAVMDGHCARLDAAAGQAVA
jgi:hypothetical protein